MRFATVATTALGVGVLAALALAAPSDTWPTQSPTQSIDRPVDEPADEPADDAAAGFSPRPADLRAARAGVIPGYHYGAAYTQTLSSPAKGLHATLTVHRPRQVKGSKGQHSVGQIAVGKSTNRSYVEAGWRVYKDGPRLFTYWRPKDGSATCYNVGCGFRDKGPGKRPGVMLEPGSRITVGFRHSHHKWWLMVNGKRSGFYPDRLWHGRFKRSDYAQVYGEVFTKKGQRLCADMGNGKRARRAGAAKITDIAFYDGPPVTLTKSPYNDTRHYSVRLTSSNSMRYGGPGSC